MSTSVLNTMPVLEKHRYDAFELQIEDDVGFSYIAEGADQLSSSIVTALILIMAWTPILICVAWATW